MHWRGQVVETVAGALDALTGGAFAAERQFCRLASMTKAGWENCFVSSMIGLGPAVTAGADAGADKVTGAGAGVEARVMEQGVLSPQCSRIDHSLSYTNIDCSICASVGLNTLIALKSGSRVLVS